MRWEALWLRLTGETVGHWLAGIGLTWAEAPPSYLRLCWRTVKRYLLFWMVGDQPSAAVPDANLLGDAARPIVFERVSGILDDDNVVTTRLWPVPVMVGLVVLTLVLVPAAGFAAASSV